MEDLVIVVPSKHLKNKKRIIGVKLKNFNLYNAELLIFGIPTPVLVARKPLWWLIFTYILMLIPFSILCIFSPKENNFVDITEMCFSYSLIEDGEKNGDENEEDFWKGFGEK